MVIRKTRIVVVFALIFVLTFTTNASAAFSVSQNDASDYSDARVVGSPPMCYYNKDWSADTGFVEVCGDHNIPWGEEYCKMEVVLRFQAPESCTSFKVAASWTITYQLKTNWPIGHAYLTVKYVLYSDTYSGLESHTTSFEAEANTQLWGQADTEEGITSRTVGYYISFTYDLQQYTYYRVAVQMYIALDGEANIWSQAGYPNPVNLDVSQILVYH